MGFYDDMQGIASDLLSQFAQGVIEYAAPAATTGPGYNPILSITPVWVKINATAKGVSTKFILNGLALTGDLQITAAVQVGLAYQIGGSIRIDGDASWRIVQIIKIPPAGTTVAYTLIVRN